MKTISELEKQKLRCKKYYKKNRDLVISRQKKRYLLKKDEITSYKLKRNYGITLEDYNILLKKQKGVCAICKEGETMVDHRTKERRKLAVDHCHKTGVIRGLLCKNCNIILGCLSDDIVLMGKVINYLSK